MNGVTQKATLQVNKYITPDVQKKHEDTSEVQFSSLPDHTENLTSEEEYLSEIWENINNQYVQPSTRQIALKPIADNSDTENRRMVMLGLDPDLLSSLGKEF